VLPKRANHSSSAIVTAVAADTAADLLVQRFATPGSCGIQQLLISCDAAALDTYTGTHQQQDLLLQQQQQHFRSWSVMPPLTADQIEEAAQQLASIPDRVQQLPEVPALLQPVCFVQQVLQQALQFISSSIHSSSSSSSSSGNSSSIGDFAPAVQVLPGATSLVARLMQKLLTRGHARHVAAALLQMLTPPDTTAAAAAAVAQPAAGHCPVTADRLVLAMQLVLLQLSSHSAAAEKLLVQLLRQSCTHNPPQHQPSNNKQVSEPLQDQQQLLKLLLCPLLVIDSHVRSIASHRLLLGRTLPASSLHLLLDMLASCQPSLVPAAAVGLAQGWSDQRTCQNVAVQQQAYMTAALVACIKLLPREVLDPAAAAGSSSGQHQFTPAALAAHLAAVRHSASGAQLLAAAAAAAPYEGVAVQQMGTLVPSILQGVSMRLASPSTAIRAQAMRVGRGFAAKLDPAKPLFEEAGELQLLADELWPGALDHAALPPHQQQAMPQQGKQSDAGNGSSAAAGAANGELETDSSSKFGALQRLQQAALETDSDDEEDTAPAAAAATAGAAGTRTTTHPAQQQNGLKHSSSTSNSKAAIIPNSSATGVVSVDDDADDSASDAGSEGSASSLVAFDLAEEAGADSWWGPDGLGLPEGKQLSLRGVAAALRKQDDVNGALEALSRVSCYVIS
jgi:hypothetical protein